MNMVEVPEELWNEIMEVLDLMRPASFPDPQHHQRVKALGREIGFGALMSTASAGWAEIAAGNNVPGSEFVIGPCRGTMVRLLNKIDNTTFL